MGDGAVARDTGGEADQASKIAAFGAFFDAFMDVAEMLFKAENRLPHRLKTKMARFNDPGMNRTNRYFVDTFAFGWNERVGAIRWRLLRRGSLLGEILPQGDTGRHPRPGDASSGVDQDGQ